MKKTRIWMFSAALILLSLLTVSSSFGKSSISLNFHYIPLYSQSDCSFLSPHQIQTAYNFTQLYSQGMDGAGESVAIVDAHGAAGLLQSLSAFDSAYGLPALDLGSNIVIVYPYGRPTVNYSNWTRETTLDVETVHSLAPGARIYLVITPDSSSLMDAVNYTINNLPVEGVSISWGAPERGYSSSSLSYVNSIFQEAYDKGINVFAASGDSGAYNGGNSLSVNFPASSPDVISVGGTVLSVSSNGDYAGETAWNGSGGGVSGFFSRPVFQPPLSSYREVPDVSFNAGTAVCAYVNGSWGGFTGTSIGAPAWTALSSLIEQRLGTAIQLLPSLYQIFYTTSLGFHLIGSGCNGFYCADGNYSMVTGIGSPISYSLVQLLSKTSYQIPFVSNAKGAVFELNGRNYTVGQTINLSFGEKVDITAYNLSLGDVRYVDPRISGLVSSNDGQTSFFLTSPGEIYINFTQQVKLDIHNYDVNRTLTDWIDNGSAVNYSFPLNYSLSGRRYALRGIQVDNGGIIYSNEYRQDVFYPANITLVLEPYQSTAIRLYGPTSRINATAVYRVYVPLSSQEEVERSAVTNGTYIFHAQNTSIDLIPSPLRAGRYLIDAYNLTNFTGSTAAVRFYNFSQLDLNFVSLSGNYVIPSEISLSGAVEYGGEYWSLLDKNITISSLQYNGLALLARPVKVYTYTSNITLHINATDVYIVPAVYLVPLPFETVYIHIDNTTLSNTSSISGKVRFVNLPSLPYSVSFSFAGKDYNFSGLKGEYQNIPIYPNSTAIYIVAAILVTASVSFVAVERFRRKLKKRR